MNKEKNGVKHNEREAVAMGENGVNFWTCKHRSS